MEAKPLNKEIYEKAKEIGVTEILLEFSGGSDEGYMNVALNHPKAWIKRTDEERKALFSLEEETERWADEVYAYSGAGDGDDYGDNISYNLKEGTVYTEEWYIKRDYEDKEISDLEIA